LLFGANTGVKSQGPDQMYNVCYKLTQSSLIAVGAYSVFQPGLKYLNFSKAIQGLKHLNCISFIKI
jgi:hypothetical protein